MDYNVTYREKDKGIQVIVSYKIDGKWKQKSKQGFSKQKDAKRHADKIIDELKNNQHLNKEFEGMTFKEFSDMHMNHLKVMLEQNTIDNYIFALKAFSELDNMKLCDIKNIHIQNIVDVLTKNRSIGTVKSYTEKISALFKVAVNQYEILSSSPIKNIQFKISKTTNNFKVLTPSESENLINNIKNPNLKLVSLISLKCGLRIGEILGLTWDNIDYKSKTITINKQWKLLSDKTYGFGNVKSKNSNRTVPLPLIVESELKKIKVVNISNRILNYKNTNAVSRNLIKTYKNIGYDISVHELRHAYATNLVSMNIDFKTIAYLMGHDVAMTMKTYSHVNDDMIKRASDLIIKNF